MSRYVRVILALCLWQVYACSPIKNSEGLQPSVAYKFQPKIDSLYGLELYSELRTYANENLRPYLYFDALNQSYLYNAIGNSYQYSYHNDSAIFYLNKVYQLSKRVNDISLQVCTAADLLIMYADFGICKEQQDSLFKTLSLIEEKQMPVSSKALLQDAIANYFLNKKMEGMGQFYLSKSQVLYNELISMISNTGKFWGYTIPIRFIFCLKKRPPLIM